MRPTERCAVALAAGVAVAALSFAVRFDGASRLAAAGQVVGATRDWRDLEPLDVLGAFLAPVNEVFQVHSAFAFGSGGELSRLALRLEYDSGAMVAATPRFLPGTVGFDAATLPRGRAWLTWRPMSSAPGLGPPISGCGTCNRPGRVSIRALRRAEGRVGVQVEVTERDLVPVSARWTVPSVDGLEARACPSGNRTATGT